MPLVDIQEVSIIRQHDVLGLNGVKFDEGGFVLGLNTLVLRLQKEDNDEQCQH